MKITILKKAASGVNFLVASFDWAMKEDFTEIRNKEWQLVKTTAEDIMANERLSTKSKILLSAVAGAAIQYLIDRKQWSETNRLWITIREG